MSKVLEDVLRQGLAGSRPAANAVVVGSYWFSTDTGVLSQSDGSSWTTIATTTVGTVTSVALTVPAILSVAGSPITSSGTLAVTLATETANTVFSGATSGGAATPTFRALVTADLPTSGVAAGTTSGITVNTAGQVTARTALVSGDLPAATTTAVGAVKQPAQFVTTAASAAVTNTTTETTLLGTVSGTKTLPANGFTAGRALRLKAFGRFQTNAVDEGIIFKIKLGSSIVGATATREITSEDNTDHYWTLDATLVNTSGNNFKCWGMVSFGVEKSSPAQRLAHFFIVDQAATATVSGTLVFDLTATWSDASTDYTITGDLATAEWLN